MGHEETRDEDLRQIEQALGSLLPRPSSLDRDRLLYLAGQASALSSPAAAQQPGCSESAPSRSRWLWPALTGASMAAAVTMAVLLGQRPEPQVVREIVYVERPRESRATMMTDDRRDAVERFDAMPLPQDAFAIDSPQLAGSNYLELRRRIFEVGLTALPEPEPGSTSFDNTAPTRRELLQEFFGEQEPAQAGPRLFAWPSFMGDML